MSVDGRYYFLSNYLDTPKGWPRKGFALLMFC